jgi:hypothetical protein
LALDSAGLPYGLFTTRAGDARPSNDGMGDDRRLYYCRYDGKQWAYHEVAKMGKRLFRSEQDYTGLGALVPGDPNTLYISTTFDPATQAETRFHEIYKGVTSDRGEHWQWTALTRDSSVDNLRPIIPQWDGNNLALLWFRGRMVRSQAYDAAIVGIVERLGQTAEKVRYVDANAKNTSLILDSGPAAGDAKSGALADSKQWQEQAGVGNEGGVLVVKGPESDDTALLKTQLSSLQNGAYDVFVYFWGKAGEDRRISAGLSPETTRPFRQVNCQAAEADQFVSGQAVSVSGEGATLYRAYLGRAQVKAGENLTAFVRGESAGESPMWYDGIGYARVVDKP